MKHPIPNTFEGRAPRVPFRPGPRLSEPQPSRSRRGFPANARFCILALALGLLTGCASAPPRASAPSTSEQAQVKQRLAEIFHATETKDLLRLDSYHWYGPHFTKFSATGQRLDAAAAREGEHKGLIALTGLKLRADDLQINVFDDAAVATFTMVATIQSGADAITKRERGTLVLVKHGAGGFGVGPRELTTGKRIDWFQECFCKPYSSFWRLFLGCKIWM